MVEFYATSDNKIHLLIDLPEHRMKYIRSVDKEKTNKLNIVTKQVEEITTVIDISKSKISIYQYVENDEGYPEECASCDIEIFPTDTMTRTISTKYWQIKYCYIDDRLKVTLSSEWLEKPW